jgi:hypothetical protein
MQLNFWRRMGIRGIAPLILKLGVFWNWVLCFTPHPLYSRGMCPRRPFDERLGGAQSQSGRSEEETISYPYRKSRRTGWKRLPHLPEHLHVWKMLMKIKHLDSWRYAYLLSRNYNYHGGKMTSVFKIEICTKMIENFGPLEIKSLICWTLAKLSDSRSCLLEARCCDPDVTSNHRRIHLYCPAISCWSQRALFHLYKWRAVTSHRATCSFVSLHFSTLPACD